MAKVETKGRKHSKRRVTIHSADSVTVELWEVRAQRVSIRALPVLKDEALAVIRASDIDPAPYLEHSPHGSGLRDAVINSHSKPGDSLPGLASRIYELAAHAEAYRKLGATDQAMNAMAELGGLVALLDNYRRATEARNKAGVESGKERRARDGNKRDAIKEAAKQIKPMADKDRNAAIRSHLLRNGISVSDTYVSKVLSEEKSN